MISDTHTKHRQLIDMPEGDILIHAGDFTNRGNLVEVYDFNNWLGELKSKYEHIITIAGNHELGFDNKSFTEKQELLSNSTYLEDTGTMINGIKIWGSPEQPFFMNWCFNFPEDHHEYKIKARELYSRIPDDTQILITHGPAYGILDKVKYARPLEDPHVGCKYLLERIGQLKSLKLHISGHIHESSGIIKTKNITYVNASVLNEDYKLTNSPKVIDF